MGQLASVPVEVDLLPPRFERPRDSLTRLPLSPLTYAFGNEDRERLFNSLVAPRGSLAVDLSVRACECCVCGCEIRPTIFDRFYRYDRMTMNA